MLTTVLWTAILMVAMLASCLQTETLDDIRVLEIGRTGRSAPAMDLPNLSKNGAITTTDRNVQNTSPAWYSLSDSREVKIQDWGVVPLMQSTRPYCRQSAPVLKAFSRKTGFDIFPISLGRKDDAEFPDVFPTIPDMMVEYFQSDLPVAMSTISLADVSTIET